jgi:tetratricopeptide (TPR) repeat protein
MVLNRIRIGERLLNLGRFEDALECFAADEAQDLHALFGSAVARQLLGRFEEAEDRYQRILSNDPRHEEALANLIAMSVERFDLERVERYSERLLRLNGEAAAALQGLAIVALERRDFRTAAHYFSRIVPADGPEGDAIEYRVSREMAERLRSLHGTVADSY